MKVRLLIRGRVQGVGYRAWMIRRATALEVSGWVRNLPDGRVEAWLDGPDEAVAALVAAAEEGPVASRVDQVWSDLESSESGITPPRFVQRD